MSWIGNGATQTKATQTKQAQQTVQANRGAYPAQSSRTTQLERDNRVKGLDIGWTVFSYLLGGMVSYGLIGWLVGRAVHVPLLFPLGMVVGLGISVGYVIYRFGRQASAAGQTQVAQAQVGKQSRVDKRTSVDGPTQVDELTGVDGQGPGGKGGKE